MCRRHKDVFGQNPSHVQRGILTIPKEWTDFRINFEQACHQFIGDKSGVRNRSLNRLTHAVKELDSDALPLVLRNTRARARPVQLHPIFAQFLFAEREAIADEKECLHFVWETCFG